MMILFTVLLLGVFGSVGAMASLEIIASSSNIRAKRHPERPRLRHWWQRWEVWGWFERGGEISGGKEYGWFPFRWMARAVVRDLEGAPELLLASMDTLQDGQMTWANFEVRRLSCE
jgi:hypothetical protein